MNIITLYECALCGERYDTADEAAACEQQSPPRPAWKAGDKAIVVFQGEEREVTVCSVFARPGYGGRHRWVIDKEPDFMLRDADHYHPDDQRFYCSVDELKPVGTET